MEAGKKYFRYSRDPDAVHGRPYKKYNASETVKRIIIARELAASGKAVLTGLVLIWFCVLA